MLTPSVTSGENDEFAEEIQVESNDLESTEASNAE
jgi:hypothetical protein